MRRAFLALVALASCPAPAPLTPEELAELSRCGSPADCVLASNAAPTCCASLEGSAVVAVARASAPELEAHFGPRPDCQGVRCPPAPDPALVANRFTLGCSQGVCTVEEHVHTGQDCTQGQACPSEYACTALEEPPGTRACIFVGPAPACVPAPLAIDAAAPAIPPNRGGCPAGWQEGGAREPPCLPWPLGLELSCPEGQVRTPGSPDCHLLLEPCGSDGWPHGLPASALYVRPGAPGGDGTRSAPLGALSAALGRATPGTVVATSTGTFDEAVTLPPGVLLRGCGLATVLRATRPGTTGAVVQVAGGEAALQDLVIRGPAIGVWSGAGSVVTLHRVLIQGTGAAGWVLLDGGEGRAQRVALQGGDGPGVSLETGARLAAVELVVQDHTGFALVAQDPGTEVEVHRLLAANTARVEPSGPGQSPAGHAVAALAGAAVGGTEWVLLEHAEVGLYAEEGGALTATTVLVRQTAGVGARALRASLRLHRASVQTGGSTAFDVRAGGIVGEDLWADLATQAGQLAGEPAYRLLSSTLLLRRTLARGGGVLLAQGSAGEAQNLGIELGAGPGLVVREGSTLDVERLRVEQAVRVSLAASDPGTQVRVADLQISGGRPDAEGFGGIGAAVLAGATLTLERAELAEHPLAGVLALGVDSRLVGGSLVVQAATTRRAVSIEQGATAVLTLLRVVGAREVGLLALSPGTRVQARGLAVDGGEGVGAGAFGRAALQLEAFQIDGCAVALARGPGATLALGSGQVTGSEVGLNLEGEGAGAETRDQVCFAVNQRDLQSTSLGLPEPTELLP